MRVLLTEGSGLTSRQVASRRGTLGHEVEILSSTPFTRHVPAVLFSQEVVSQKIATRLESIKSLDSQGSV